MPNKEIIRVEIDDSEFSEFKKKFDAYEAAVKALQGEWAKSGTEIAVQRSHFEVMADSIRSQAEDVANLVTSHVKLGAALDGTALALAGMARSGKQFAGHIFQATASLRHWTKLTAVFSGLVGAGGLFGINRLAESVSRNRTSAVGLGVTYGERASFLANFGRLPNAEGLLQGFSGAETNISKQYALRQYLGHGASGDPAKDFAEGLGRFKDLVDRTPKELLGPALRQRGYDKLGLDTETALTVKGMSRGEIEQISRGYGADLATRLGLAPDVAKKWTEFTTKIEKAGEDIDTILWKGTGKLAKPLEHLSEGFEHLVSALFRDGSPISGWIKDLGHGISEFADELGGRTIQAKAAQLGNDVAAVARLLEAIVTLHPQGLAVLLGIYEAAKWGGGPAVAIGEALAGTALGTGAAAAAGAGAVGLGMNKLMPQHPELLRRGQEYENAGGAPTSPHPAMTRARKGDWQGPMQPDAQGPWQGPMQPPRGAWQGPPMPKGVFPKMAPAKPGSLSGRQAVEFDTSSAEAEAGIRHARRYQGQMRVGNQYFDYASGSNRRGRGSSPFGQHPITMFDPSAMHGRGGGAFRTRDVYDPQIHSTRGAVEIHMSHQEDVNRVETAGCFGIPASEWPGAKTAIQQYMRQHGGATLLVHPNGSAEVVPSHRARMASYAPSATVSRHDRRGAFGHPHIGHHPATVSHAQHTTMIEDQSGGMVSVMGDSSSYGGHPSSGGEGFRRAADFYRKKPEHFQPMSGNVEDRRFEGDLRGGILPNVPDAPIRGNIAKRLSGPGKPLGAHHPSGLPPIEKSVDDYIKRINDKRWEEITGGVPQS